MNVALKILKERRPAYQNAVTGLQETIARNEAELREYVERHNAEIESWRGDLTQCEADLADIDTAIAALEPAPAEPVTEPEPEPSLFDAGAIDIQTALPVEQEPDVIFAESGLHGELFAGKPYRVYVQTGLSGGGNYFDTLDEAQAYADALIIQTGVMLVRVQDCSDADQTVDLFVWPREEAAPADPEPTELDAEPASVLDNPELLAAVERAQQTLDSEPAA